MKYPRMICLAAVLWLAGCGSAPSDPVPQGPPPVIRTILVEDADVRVGSGIHFKPQLESESGRLTYAWQASSGIVYKPYEQTLTWIAPPTVPYSPYPVTVGLTVKDEFGRTVKSSTLVRVYSQ